MSNLKAKNVIQDHLVELHTISVAMQEAFQTLDQLRTLAEQHLDGLKDAVSRLGSEG